MKIRSRRSADSGSLRRHTVEGVEAGTGPLRSGADLSVVQPGGTLLVRGERFSVGGDMLLAIDLTDDDLRDLLVRRLRSPSRREGALSVIGAALSATAGGELDADPGDVLARAGGNRALEDALSRMLRTHRP
jgi:hypothetical protein